MNTLISMTEKSSKKKIVKIKPKKPGNRLEYPRELIEEFRYDNFLIWLGGDEKLIVKLKK